MTQTKHALIFAHYHQAGKVRRDTVNALRHFSQFFDRVIFVSTKLDEAEIGKICSLCEIQVRENVGFDFSSYREGIMRLFADGEPCRVSLFNSSVVMLQPQKLMENYFHAYAGRLPTPFFGLTKSEEVFPHLQGFLMTFEPEVWSEGCFIDWWKTLEPALNRIDVVQKYEIGLSIFMQCQDIAISSAYQFSPRGIQTNPSHGAGADLLEKYGLVKIELYKKNPSGVDLGFLIPILETENWELLEEGLEN